jgi:serine protease Do
MNTRTRTIASLFSVAMAAMLLGALVTSQIQRPEAALARPVEATVALPAPGQGASFGLDTFREVARRVNPGVVNINTSQTVRRRGQDPFREFFGDDMMDRFFGQNPQRRERPQVARSLGSGFVIDKDGYILTNRHVIEGADEISVTFPFQKLGDRPYTAKLVGKDARTDVALIKVDPPRQGLTVLELGDSDQAEVGDWVMAIGNPFGLGGNSATVGVVSFKGRPVEMDQNQRGTRTEVLQTDAAINPGNSGGPLLNTRGEVIGINAMIVTQNQQFAGVGFAVPINTAKDILAQLRDKGKVVRGWLGVSIFPVTDETAKTYKMKEARGAAVTDVNPGSPAEKAGIVPEDVVIGVDGRAIEDNADLSRYIASKAPGTRVSLRVLRGGVEKTIEVTLGTFPDESVADQGPGEDKGKLGMSLRNLTPDMAEHLELPRGASGVVVTDVEPGEAADDAGLRQGDVIVSVNGSSVSDVNSFGRAIEQARPDGVVRLRVRRGNNYLFAILRFK